MNLFTVALIVLALVLVQGLGLYFVLKRREMPQEDTGGLVLLQQQMQELARTLDQKVSESSRMMQENSHRQFAESNRLVKEITEELTSVKEIGRQTQSYAEQLKNLQDILKNPKQRGILGEYYLETTLKNVLPPGMYQMQYPFKNGEVVDAVIITKEGIIPIDAKFSLDNYNRVTQAIDDKQREELEKEFKNDLKKRIDETAKYVRPEEGTLPFAFMFIPAEGIYYDLLVNEVGAVKVNTRNLIDYAYNDKKVIIVSPTTFSAYLQSVLYGFKAFKVEQAAQDIVKRIGELQKHWKAHEEYMEKLGSAMSTTVNHYNAAYKELGKVDKDVMRITGEGVGFEVKQLEKPVIDRE
jgi:DNA recombination protein RmuC